MANNIDSKNEGAEQTTPKGSKVKLLILLVLVLAILGGGGFVVWKFLWPSTPPIPGDHEIAESVEQKLIPGELVTLEPFVVNLSDPMGRRYLKVTLDIELADTAAVADLERARPMVKDMLLMLLSSKSFADIGTMDQKLELKNSIVDRLNQILGTGKVRNVYFTEFVVQ
ncbi:MAG: flagellar basal body-associated FliL family protein [Desulfomicrobium sp.]|jgi:flagellar FliL protein|nr:flagellar basal body-associated FliL family protein [Desulfomicrobium sp.]